MIRTPSFKKILSEVRVAHGPCVLLSLFKAFILRQNSSGFVALALGTTGSIFLRPDNLSLTTWPSEKSDNARMRHRTVMHGILQVSSTVFVALAMLTENTSQELEMFIFPLILTLVAYFVCTKFSELS